MTVHLQVWKSAWAANERICSGTRTPLGFLAAWYFSRLKLRLPALFPPAISISARVDGKQVRLPVRLNTDDAVALRGTFADGQYSTPLIEGDIKRVLDLGAHCGFALAYLSARFPDARFACVEPDPRNVLQLMKTIEMNALPATVFMAGVSARSGLMSLSIDPERPSCSQLGQGMNAITVPVLTVDELLAKMQWDEVDLIKMDIEGMEHELVTQSGPAMKKARHILFELHNWIDTQAVLTGLGSLGFQVSQVNTAGEQVYLATRLDN